MRTALLAVAVALALASSAAAEGPVTLPGGPLSVSVGPLGQCQSGYAGLGNDFYPPAATLGDCGFFLGFPEAGNPSALARKVYGFEGTRGPGVSAQYAPVGQSAVSGSGTTADPYQLITRFKLGDPTKTSEGDYALIVDTTTYVSGEAQFTSTFDVENVTGQSDVPGVSAAPAGPLRFHAIYAGDLTPAGGTRAAGVLLGGPPRLVGAASEALGSFDALVEAPPPSPPWTSYAAGCWNVVPEPAGNCPAASPGDGGIWTAVRQATSEAPVFDDIVDTGQLEGGVGVSWDDRLTTPLKPGEHAIYSIVNRTDVPAKLTVTPATPLVTVGQAANVSVLAVDDAGLPYADRPIVYTIGGANPKLGSVLTNAEGVATISYTGTVAGADTVEAFLDLEGSGTRTPRDPAGSARVNWTTAAGASANSEFTVRSEHVGADGTIALVLVPAQAGTATVTVTVPTAALVGRTRGAKRVRCPRGEAAIGGRCRPRASRSGKLSANGRAGAALKLTVRASSAVRRAIAAGRSVQLTADVTYRAKLGGVSSQTLRFAVSRKRPHRR